MSSKARVRLLTPSGLGGIAVIELTGPGAAGILQGCFRAATADVTFETGRICYGHVVRGAETLDEVIVARVPTKTGQPVFEINCHGGTAPARRIMGYLGEQGAQEGSGPQALPGRTLRKLERDLLEQLIDARTQRAADVLLVQLSGTLRAELERIASGPVCRKDGSSVERLLGTYVYGRRLTRPATVVVTGAPNVGKSTLANALVGRERSIVHHLPGTTRDAVTSVASLEGLPVIVVDTAGLRQATDEIEHIGVRRALERAGACDLIVWVFDHSRGMSDEEAGYLKVLRMQTLVPVINKIDLAGPLDEATVREMFGSNVERTCALSGRGIDNLRGRIFTALVDGEVPGRDAAVLTTESVAAALQETASTGGAASVAALLAQP